MLDIKYIRENPDKIKENNKNRGVNVDLDRFLDLDKKRVELIQEVDALRAQKKQPKGKPTPEDLKKLKEIKEKEEKLAKELSEIEREYRDIYLEIPNLTHSDVPIGKDENENVSLRKVGEIPKMDFKPKDHLELGESLDLIDMQHAAKITGARFFYLKNELVLLEYALLQLVFQTLTNEDTLKEIAKKAGLTVSTKSFTPILPPDMIKPKYLEAMGRLEPKEDKFYTEKDELYLVGSAEHTIGAMHADEILDEKDLPLRYIGFSTAFRREAGSYGKDTRGIIRVHQFDKSEIVSFTTPETGEAEQDFIIAIQEYLMQQIGLPYQAVAICTGDMGDPDYRQVDLEAWIPTQNKYRETHTSDYNTDYQARRLNIKVKRSDGKTEFVHMNDATAFAGRPMVAILENYQQKDGSVKIPEVLQKYMGGLKVIKQKK
ncbi:serine--tRNA ligase [candidate division WS5 bacterium]|uniref:Serine--tRNA ligase n=1 Tax=candidate division WS5 bacterium TaxID=2093353 RepID=A0A419D9Z3_9BACT|nr:MAG: serine--tRNA ligase [candidate division WS5 bacterium]